MPVAIAVALVIAGMKGTMVAAVFMHLSHERVVGVRHAAPDGGFLLVLLFLPVLTSLDGLGTGSPWRLGKPGDAECR